VRSGVIPLAAEAQLDSEDQWCLSKGLTKMGTADTHRQEIESYLPFRSAKLVVNVDRPSIQFGETQTWNAQGLASNSEVRVLVASGGTSFMFSPNLVADSSGKVRSAFTIGDNLSAGVVKLRVESVSDPLLYDEADFTVAPAEGIMSLRYSSPTFRIFSDFMKDISWFFPYIERVYAQLKEKLGHEPSQHLPIKCTIKKGPEGGIGGWTASGEMGVKAGDFTRNRWCLVISAQELVNLFTGSVTSGWPTDWWANHRSPFPIMVAVEIVRDLGYLQEASDYDLDFQKDPLYMWHKNLKVSHGWDVYRNMLSAMKMDQIRLDQVGENPSPTLTNYVLAYMKIGTPTFRPQLAERTIPGADSRIVEDIARVRQKLGVMPSTDSRWREYLSGNYRQLL